ncbi:exported signaling peptide, YydF/SAG_2028 family [Propionibacterium cyclohexanicum]|uniref:Exported signaling peptide, YydF/SAG_2028 family n=2 Tax=Propionibacterium cyclohexanicum TaxID=64702 RepID=A0A1H9S7V0_9ACTN|nr:exported signaling peptide, YydF/SAG_2028 family [Propionibacterium cyclohexanicum]
MLSNYWSRLSQEQEVTGMDKESDSKDLMDEFTLDDEVTELASVDDLWYFVTKNGSWVVGTG